MPGHSGTFAEAAQELGFPADVEHTTLAAPVRGRGFFRPLAQSSQPGHEPVSGSRPSDPAADGTGTASDRQGARLHRDSGHGAPQGRDDGRDKTGPSGVDCSPPSNRGNRALEWQPSRAVLARLSGQLSLAG